MVSLSTKEEAIDLIEEVKDVLPKGRFRLTTFAPNNRNVLETIPDEEHAPPFKDVELDKDILPCEKAQGVEWNVEYNT